MDELDIAQTPEGATEVVMVKRAGSGAAPRTGA
jgi:hypothetical protein